MKIKEIVLEGLLGSIGKGLADIVAPGAVEKYQAAKTSQAIDKKSNIVNYQGRQYQWLGNQWGQLNPNAFPNKPVNFQNAQYRWLGQQWGQIANVDPITKKEKYSVVPADIQKQLTASFSKPRGMTVAPTAIQQQLNVLSTRKPIPRTPAEPSKQPAAKPVTPLVDLTTIQPATKPGTASPAEQAKLQQKIQAALAAQGK
jgi:hypothetical protein